MEVTEKTPTSVLYVITKATWGGAQHYVYDLITEAHKRGLAPGLAYGEPGILSERVEALGVPVYQIKGLQRDISLLEDMRAYVSFYRILKQVRPDIVHLNSSKAGFAGALTVWFIKVSTWRFSEPKIVFTVHGWAFTEPRNILSKLFFLILHYFTCDLSNIVIANSNATASYTKWWPFVKNKVQMIPLGIDAVAFKSKREAREALIAQNPLLAEERDNLWIGTIAELHKNKGIDIGIRAWKRAKCADADWVVLGGGEDDVRLEEQAHTVNGIYFLGFVPDASVYLKAFDIFLLPSRSESAGYVLLEAGLAELPVIATQVGGIPETLGGAGLLVRKDAPDELAKALTDLCANPDKRAMLGAALFERVREKFPLSKMLDETFELYKS